MPIDTDVMLEPSQPRTPVRGETRPALLRAQNVNRFLGSGEARTHILKGVDLTIDRGEMTRQLRTKPRFAGGFLTHMLTRNIRIEEDLIDQLFNSTEKRLARTLLLLARYGEPEISHRALPRVSQQLLAEMVGTTRSRVNFFMNKFRKLGFIDYNGDLKINNSLLSVLLRD